MLQEVSGILPVIAIDRKDTDKRMGQSNRLRYFFCPKTVGNMAIGEQKPVTDMRETHIFAIPSNLVMFINLAIPKLIQEQSNFTSFSQIKPSLH